MVATVTIVSLVALVIKVVTELVTFDDDDTVLLLGTLDAVMEIVNVRLKLADTVILAGDFSLGVLMLETNVGKTGLDLVDAGGLVPDLGTQTLDGGMVIIALTFDDADSLLGVSVLALKPLVAFNEVSEFTTDLLRLGGSLPQLFVEAVLLD